MVGAVAAEQMLTSTVAKAKTDLCSNSDIWGWC